MRTTWAHHRALEVGVLVEEGADGVGHRERLAVRVDDGVAAGVEDDGLQIVADLDAVLHEDGDLGGIDRALLFGRPDQLLFHPRLGQRRPQLLILRLQLRRSLARASAVGVIGVICG